MIETILVASVVGFFAYKVGKQKGAFSGKRASAPKLSDSGVDNFEGWFYKGDDPRSVHANLELVYVDAKSNRTKRRVRVRQYDPSLSGGMVLAHCHLRHETRCFRIDRIKSCVDTDTGEVIKRPRAFFEKRHEASPDKIVNTLAYDYRDIVRVLGFVALTDGRMDEREKAVIAKYLLKLTRDNRVSPTVVGLAVDEVGKTSLHGFKAAVGRVVNSGAVSPVLLAGCCREIAMADGAVSGPEQEALEYLDRKILAAPVE